MQRLDDVEIGDQGAQFGGRAELQLGAGIDVERLVHAVGVDAQVVAVRPALVQHEAVGHLAECCRQGAAGVRPCPSAGANVGSDSLCRTAVTRAWAAVSTDVSALRVEPVERVKVGWLSSDISRERDSSVAFCLTQETWVIGGGSLRNLSSASSVASRRFRSMIAGVVERPEIAVAQFAEAFAIADQVMARQAAGEQQRQHLAIDLALASPLFLVLGRCRFRTLVGLVEVGAEPDPERVGQADHLAIAGQGAERGRIEIGRDDLRAPIHRICAVDVDMRRGGQHLPQFFAHPAGQAVAANGEISRSASPTCWRRPH